MNISYKNFSTAMLVSCVSLGAMLPAHAENEIDVAHQAVAASTSLTDCSIHACAHAECSKGACDHSSQASFWDSDYATGQWGGAREHLAEQGIVIEADLTFDFSQNFGGGATGWGSASRHLFNFNTTLDTEGLGLWSGGTFFVNFQNINGPGIGDEVGDVQGVDNVDSDGRTQVGEIWYEQFFAEDTLRFRVGKFDANGDFAYSDNAGEFLNSSMGFSPTIFTFPSYPDTAFGLSAFAYPTESLYVGLGLFDGALQEGIPTGSRGPKSLFDDPADLMYVAEAGMTWDLDDGARPGRAAVGFWFHDGDFTEFGGGTADEATGIYVVLDQVFWREDPSDDESEQGIAGFFQYGYADPDLSSVEHHIGLGVTWAGLIDTRDDDILGLGLTTAILSDEAGSGFTDDHETAIELFYRLQLTPFMSIKPDLQYIANPGGAGADDAFVATARLEVLF